MSVGMNSVINSVGRVAISMQILAKDELEAKTPNLWHDFM